MTGRHTRESKHKMDDKIRMREGKITNMFLCKAGSNINSRQHEAEMEAKDDPRNVLSLGIEKLKAEYETKIRTMKRIAQVADRRCKTSEKEKIDLDEKLRRAETKIHRLQKDYKENEKANGRLRQEFDKHMRECTAKQEKVMQMEEADPIKTQKTNSGISSMKSLGQMIGKEKATSSRMNCSNETSGFESEASCSFPINRKDNVASSAGKSTRLYEMLEKLESVISKLGNIAQESVERELKLEEEFSQIKRSILGFSSRFRTSLSDGAIRNLPAMLPEVQSNDVDNSSRTKSATSNGTSKYIATLCEVGETLCTESKRIAAAIANRNGVEDLRKFEDYVQETVRTEIDSMRSIRDEITKYKKTL